LTRCTELTNRAKVVRQLAKTENLLAMRDAAALKAQCVVIDRASRCAVCDKAFRADSAFVRVPESDSGVGAHIVHVACYGRGSA